MPSERARSQAGGERDDVVRSFLRRLFRAKPGILDVGGDSLRSRQDASDLSESEAQAGVLTRHPPTHVFAIISWGCAATAWIARAVNSHPDIYCVHAANMFWSSLGNVPRLDGLRYLTLLGSQASFYSAAGDVHGVHRAAVPELRATLGEMFGCAVVVREPVARLRSQYRLFQEANFHGWGDLAYVDAIAESARIDPSTLSREQRHFLHGVNMLNAVVAEQQIGRIFRCEDVTSNPEALCELVGEVTRGKVACDRRWAEAAIGAKPVNAHSGDAPLQLGEWEWRVLRSCVTTAAWRAYEALGYQIPRL